MRAGNAIGIVIDPRERRGGVPAALEGLGRFSVEWRVLKEGDYLVDGTLLFERKTLVDLVASIQDGRLFAQALRMRKAAASSALVLEGRASSLAEIGMRWEAIQGALVTIAVSIGLPILRTRTPAETARTLLFAGEQRRRHACGALPRKGRRPSGKAALQRSILQALPGIGPARARGLLQRFGSVEDAIGADAASLADVPGIGAATAQRIRWAVSEASGVYCAAEELAPGTQ